MISNSHAALMARAEQVDSDVHKLNAHLENEILVEVRKLVRDLLAALRQQEQELAHLRDLRHQDSKLFNEEFEKRESAESEVQRLTQELTEATQIAHTDAETANRLAEKAAASSAAYTDACTRLIAAKNAATHLGRELGIEQEKVATLTAERDAARAIVERMLKDCGCSRWYAVEKDALRLLGRLK